MPSPCVSLRCDQLIPINKEVNKKEQLEMGLEEEEEKKRSLKNYIYLCRLLPTFFVFCLPKLSSFIYDIWIYNRFN
jgi:hypothetical protein